MQTLHVLRLAAWALLILWSAIGMVAAIGFLACTSRHLSALAALCERAILAATYAVLLVFATTLVLR